MTGYKSKFEKLELKDKGFVTYGDNNKGRIRGSGVISNEASFNIHNVLLVEGLKHNLVSISQLCDKGYKVDTWLWYKRNKKKLTQPFLSLFQCFFFYPHNMP